MLYLAKEKLFLDLGLFQTFFNLPGDIQESPARRDMEP